MVGHNGVSSLAPVHVLVRTLACLFLFMSTDGDAGDDVNGCDVVMEMILASMVLLLVN